MNPSAALSVVAAAVGAVVAIVSLRIGSAPGWHRYRALAAVGATAAAYALLNTCWSLDLSLETQVVALHLEGAVVSLHVVAWRAYTRHHLGTPPRRADRAITVVLLVVAALWLVPGLMFRRVTVSADVPWLGLTYRLPEITGAGSLSFVLDAALLCLPTARYLRAARRGMDGARLHALALMALLVPGINDTLASAHLIQSPQLLGVGFVAAVGALGWDLTRAFAASARALDELSRRLEDLVGERTRALVTAESALLRTEKMAALGRLSTSVAHEIDDPAVAVEESLVLLRNAIETGPLPHDAAARLGRSLTDVARIASTVKGLLDAIARAREPDAPPPASGARGVVPGLEAHETSA